jgi:hypothetical protein
MKWLFLLLIYSGFAMSAYGALACGDDAVSMENMMITSALNSRNISLTAVSAVSSQNLSATPLSLSRSLFVSCNNRSWLTSGDFQVTYRDQEGRSCSAEFHISMNLSANGNVQKKDVQWLGESCR